MRAHRTMSAAGSRRSARLSLLLIGLCTAGTGCELEGRLPLGPARDGGQDASVLDAAREDAWALTHRLTLLQLNLANLDPTTGGPCPAYYLGTQCERDAELEIAGFFFSKGAWDIVVLNSIWDAERCQGYSESDPNKICHDYTHMIPYQQVRRLLGPDYTIICDHPAYPAHADCVGVRKGRLRSDVGTLEVQGCASGDLCFGAAKTPPPPAACAGMQGHGSVSFVHLTLKPGLPGVDVPLTVVNVHAFDGARDDPAATACRRAQFKQVFEIAPSGRTIVAGTIATDPRLYSCAYPDMAYWCTKVGQGKAQPFHYHAASSVTRISDKTAVDVVVSNFLGGSPCLVTHENKGNTTGFWGRLDHRAVACDGLSFSTHDAPACGDGTCAAPLESCLTCLEDCGSCLCGDGSCTASDGESCLTCPADCGQCP